MAPAMEPDEVRAAAHELLAGHGLDDWTFTFDRALRRVGACFYRERRISLSRAFVAKNDDTVVIDTLRHEVAHALAWVHDGATGHGTAWRRWCAVTGAQARRCYEPSEVAMPPARYRCTVLASEVTWTSGSGILRRTGVARTPLREGEIFERHRLSRGLRTAIEIGMISVLDTRTGRLVEG